MPMKRCILPFYLWLTAAVAWTTLARAAETPSVDTILAKYVTASGGKAALEKITSRVFKIRVESDSFGASEGEVYAVPPNKQRTHLDLSGAGSMDEGFDGAVAWAKSPWEGLRVKAGDELAKVKRDAEFSRILKMKTIYPDLACKGTEKVGEEEAYVLESKPTATSQERFWFSTKSGLILRQESEFQGPQGKVSTTGLIQEYKAVDGIKYPEKIKLKISAGDQVFEFTMKFLEIQQNVKVEDSKFAKPAA
jgi:hypothetical protein